MRGVDDMTCKIRNAKTANMLLSRRMALGVGAGLAATIAKGAYAQSSESVLAKVREVESRLQSRLGIAIVDLQTGRRWDYRPDERFPMCSTFKGLAAAAVLARVDEKKESLARSVVFQQADIVTYSPVTKDHAGEPGMTLGDICAAALAMSDNTAGNLMLKAIGGPEGLTAFLRGIGDTVTRLDRWETELNEGKPGDVRDTSSPAALTDTMRKLVLENTLSPASRDTFTAWLVGNKVGDAKVRAGVPKDWKVADKTGGGGFGTNNDTGVIWPPGRKPVVYTILTTETAASFEDKNAGMADIARALHATLTA